MPRRFLRNDASGLKAGLTDLLVRGLGSRVQPGSSGRFPAKILRGQLLRVLGRIAAPTGTELLVLRPFPGGLFRERQAHRRVVEFSASPMLRQQFPKKQLDLTTK